MDDVRDGARYLIERAARLGDAWLAEPGMTIEVAAERIAIHREACVKHRRVPETIPIRRDVYVGETLQAARRDMAGLLARGYRGFDPECLVVGDVASVTDNFARLGELGYDQVLVRNITAGQSQARATIERPGEVRQRLATHCSWKAGIRLPPLPSRDWNCTRV